MELFLDSYYYYSWIRLYNSGVKERIEEEIKKRGIRRAIIFNDLQLPVPSVKRLEDKIIALQQGIISYLNEKFVVKRSSKRSSKKIDLLKLINRGISDEYIPLVEYILLCDDSGNIDDKMIRKDPEIVVTDDIRRRIADLSKSVYPSINPHKYRDYLITRVSKVLGIRVDKEQYPGDPIIDPDVLISEAKVSLCDSEEAKKGCDVVKRSKNVFNHPDDVRLAVAVATYARKTSPLLVVPKLPANYECFHHLVKYVRQKTLASWIIILE